MGIALTSRLAAVARSDHWRRHGLLLPSRCLGESVYGEGVRNRLATTDFHSAWCKCTQLRRWLWDGADHAESRLGKDVRNRLAQSCQIQGKKGLLSGRVNRSGE